MSVRHIPATELAVGMVLALPFGKTATISALKRGRTFMNFTTEFGANRVGLSDEVAIEVEP